MLIIALCLLLGVSVGLLAGMYLLVREQGKELESLSTACVKARDEVKALTAAIARSNCTPVFFEPITPETSDTYWEGKPRIEKITAG